MNPKNSQDLFNKIRSQFTNVRLGDENGAATANPADAVFFEFEFRKSKKNEKKNVGSELKDEHGFKRPKILKRRVRRQ